MWENETGEVGAGDKRGADAEADRRRVGVEVEGVWREDGDDGDVGEVGEVEFGGGSSWNSVDDNGRRDERFDKVDEDDDD